VEPELGLFVVADGMGGAQAGELASAIAIETIVQGVRCAAPSRTSEILVQAIAEANRNILAQANENPDYQGMGTTVVAVLVNPPAAHVASVGDSRLYRLQEGRLARITSDQTWVNEVGRSLGLTDEQIHTHPFRNVLTMAVGARERIDIHHHELTLGKGDLLLLCSDGLHGVLPEEELAGVLSSDRPLPEIAADLIARARARGGPDNITAVLVQNAE
jgi:protein phosphatase